MLLRRIIPYLVYLYMTLVGKTSRIRWEGMEHLSGLESGTPAFIYAFWHNRQALFTYTHRGTDAAVLVSKSRDGELIAETMRLSRIPSVRGSSSRGGPGALRELIEAAALGRRPGVSPDGPKGPACKVKPGILHLALKTGLPILPISNAASRKVILRKSWDRFQIPLPFGSVCIIYGPPVCIAGSDDLNAKALELEEALNHITAEAERLVGH